MSMTTRLTWQNRYKEVQDGWKKSQELVWQPLYYCRDVTPLYNNPRYMHVGWMEPRGSKISPTRITPISIFRGSDKVPHSVWSHPVFRRRGGSGCIHLLATDLHVRMSYHPDDPRESIVYWDMWALERRYGRNKAWFVQLELEFPYYYNKNVDGAPPTRNRARTRDHRDPVCMPISLSHARDMLLTVYEYLLHLGAERDLPKLALAVRSSYTGLATQRSISLDLLRRLRDAAEEKNTP